jgi:hypothetical protein
MIHHQMLIKSNFPVVISSSRNLQDFGVVKLCGTFVNQTLLDEVIICLPVNFEELLITLGEEDSVFTWLVIGLDSFTNWTVIFRFNVSMVMLFHLKIIMITKTQTPTI